MLKKAVYPALEELKMPRVGWRGFHHAVATLLQHLGVSVKVAQLFPGVSKFEPNAQKSREQLL